MAEIPHWGLDEAMDVLLDALEKKSFKEDEYRVKVALYTISKEEEKGNEKAKAIANFIREITSKNKEEN